MFGIVAFQRNKKRLHVISDRISQYPIFYLYKDRSLSVTSLLAAFCRFNDELVFNEEWFWEYLYINFPVGSTTLIKGVKKLPPATVLTFDLDSASLNMK